MNRDEWEITADRDECRVSLDIRIPDDDVEEFRKQALNEVRQEVDEPGFRQGKVPAALIEKKYGQAVRQQLAEKLVPEAFQTAYRRHDIRPVDEPSIEDMDLDGEFSLQAEVETQPEFDVSSEDYEDLDLERTVRQVDEERVEEELDDLRSEQADLQPIPITRPIQEGDFVTLDLQGYDEEGEMIEGTSGEDMIVEVGAGRFLDDLEEGLIGLEEGGQARIPATFPEDFVEESLAGEQVAFDVNIKQIQEERAPELDDPEFLEDYEVESADELRDEIRDALQRSDEQSNEEELRQQVYDKLLERFDFPLPESLVEREIDSMLEQQKQQLQNQGRSFEDFLEEQDQTEEDLRDQLEDEARRRISLSFILGRIGEIEEVSVSDQEVRERFEQMAGQYGMDPEELEQNVDDSMRDNIRFQLRDEKVVKQLIRKASVTEVDPDETQED